MLLCGEKEREVDEDELTSGYSRDHIGDLSQTNLAKHN